MLVSNAVFHLADAYDRFFKNKIIFLNSKAKENLKSRIQQILQNNNILIGKNVIKLPKVGMVKAVIHRLPKDDWKLKSVTVSQDSVGNYFASVLFEYEQEDIPSVSKSSTNAIGLDYKSDGLIWTVMGIKQEFINTIEKVIRSLLKNKEDFYEKRVLKRMKQNQATVLNK